MQQLQAGMMLVAVGGVTVRRMAYADCIKLLKGQGRPLTLRFAVTGGLPPKFCSNRWATAQICILQAY